MLATNLISIFHKKGKSRIYYFWLIQIKKMRMFIQGIYLYNTNPTVIQNSKKCKWNNNGWKYI